ncbi:MAG TPA: class I SAM-dependent methyltransferase [Rhizomicrobium sp.]|nr:class I SAM-dependent methyltransferase [Rhizomicrobium sp.]
MSQIPVREGYEAWAASYDTNVNATRDMDARALIAADLPLSGARVIEAGCGTGKNTGFLAARAANLLALDFSPAMLEVARGKIGSAHVRFAEHDITTPWPAPDGWAHVVVSNLVLEHIADIAPVLKQIARVLAPGGIAYLAELHPYRQLGGSQAKFESEAGTQLVESFAHGMADYINGAIAAGLTIMRLEEHADTDGRPRLLALTLRAK